MNYTFNDLNVDLEMSSITNVYERLLAKDTIVFKQLNSGVVPRPGRLLGKEGSESISWRELDALGFNPSTYHPKMWFYPVQSFLKIYNDVYRNYPDVGTEARVAIAYYNWRAAYAEPQTEPESTLYQIKLNTLKEFINSIGFSSAYKKAEAEVSRKGQAAQAQAAAAAAAEVYAEAKRKQAEEAKRIQESDSPTDISVSSFPVLPVLAVGALLLLVLRR